jgi:monovalent cation:H+ antiporter, CPA1 family
LLPLWLYSQAKNHFILSGLCIYFEAQMNLDVFLSIFTLMLIALGVNLLAAKIRLPYTVLLVIVGSFLVPLSQIESLSFISSFELTPESLFFMFLPIHIFESAYNMNFRDVGENKYSMGILLFLGY